MEINEITLYGTIFALFLGFLLKIYPPKYQLGFWRFMGFNTPNAKSSQKKWDEAQRYSSKLMILFFSSSFVIQLLFRFFNYSTIFKAHIYSAGLFLVIPMLLIKTLTEKHIKKYNNGIA